MLELARGLAILGALAGAAGCADPVHDEAVSKLGGEVAGVPEGPLHRPGQPCVTCHGADGPAESEFSVAGTVFLLLRDHAPAVGAVVEVEDITGRVVPAGTNEAGNFYVPRSYWEPEYPITARVSFRGVRKQMTTHAGRAGSCADCHLRDDIAGQYSPGHIYIATSAGKLPPGTLP